jgi:peptide/nickel transport system permease protein
MLPFVLPALLVQATFGVSGAIVAEASLSFLGLGVPAPTPSWGSMLDEGRQFLLVAPHLVLAPGVALAATVLALQLAGDRLRDRLDVRADRAD